MHKLSCHLFRVAALAAAFTAASAAAKTVTDTYDFKMTLQVPRIYDNMESQGYRAYQRQTIRGKMHITYDDAVPGTPSITFTGVYNVTHKVNGKSVTYEVTTTYETPKRVNAIGSNSTGKFKIASVTFGIEAQPSYAIAAPDEDNSLYLTLSAKGLIGGRSDKGGKYIKSLSGSAAGSIGCACKEYGHVSPTRVMGAYGPTDLVDDIGSVFGTWSAKRVKADR